MDHNASSSDLPPFDVEKERALTTEFGRREIEQNLKCSIVHEHCLQKIFNQSGDNFTEKEFAFCHICFKVLLLED